MNYIIEIVYIIQLKMISQDTTNTSKVIIICGFLGSGKTTLVESILKAPVLNKKVAVIQNEFSANMGIESTLMKDSDGNDIQDFYEMPNGCICCAAKDDLINTLDALLEK
jgi:G3E family GTPase